ncbi:MAG: hypothetical protein EXR50_03380, partial [Dehalococcoidia bacterium]|nr:hypothetical protein [Dehalococcoidia bacterium]
MSALDSIPLDLHQLQQWVNFKIVPQPGGKKPQKKPYVAGSDKLASSTDPATWRSFEDAVKGIKPSGTHDALGVAFSESDPCGQTGRDPGGRGVTMTAWRFRKSPECGAVQAASEFVVVSTFRPGWTDGAMMRR